MAKKYASNFNPNKTPQSEPLAGRKQAKNNAGGYVFEIDLWARLERFLILGSDAATYYQNAKKLTRENGANVMACWAADAERTAQVICDISYSGRAARQSPAIFALALGAICEKPEARNEAYRAVQIVCRTASHLFEWLSYCEQLGKGWGRGIKRAVVSWYSARKTDTLAYQMIKFRERNGFNHKRAIELAHKGAGDVDQARKALYLWARGKDHTPGDLPQVVQAHLYAMAQDEASKMLVETIVEHKLPWEAIPNQFLREAKVWEAMQPTMGMTALIRNLGNMTETGAITGSKFKAVRDRLTSEDELKKARIHPFNVLQALAVYKSGRGFKGSKSWSPVPKIVDALDDAFYKAFANVEPTGKRIYLALDVSGSMGSPLMGSPLTCREAAAAMALVTLATEDNTMVYGFTGGRGISRYNAVLTELDITPNRRLDDVVAYMAGLPFGGTDCALPMIHAAENGLEVDVFLIITDNESWAGQIHPVEALKAYRKKMGIPAKCVVLAMTSTGFSIADPEDGGMLDICGMDSHVPALISDFARS